MPSLRQIRSRLRSTQSTKQIMRAMQLVSASKLKRSQGKLQQARDVLGFLDGLLQRLLAVTPHLQHPLCARVDGMPNLLVMFTSDTGLCGSYNTNLMQLAEAQLRQDTFKRTQVVFIGKKGYRYFTKRGVTAAEVYLDLAGRPDLAKAELIARALLARFLTGEVSSIHLVYSQFVSSTLYRPSTLQWLPITFSDKRQVTSDRKTVWKKGQYLEYPVPYLFEPSAERVLTELLPRWTVATFQLVMLEAFTAEHSARMIAMKNATDNAEELMQRLTLLRNKIRQASITKEISEIVGTAEALK